MDAMRMKVVLSVAVLVCSVGQVSAQPAALPHILFIVADDLGWNDVNWREPNMWTPTLNRFALNGIILNNSYVQPLCSPSRSAFMSGMFPYHTGLQHGVIGRSQQAYLPGNLTTLPEALKKLGYATHAVGKWHLGFCNWKYTPTLRGFDSFLGYYGAAEDYYTHMAGGFDFRNNKEVDVDDNGTYSAYVFEERAFEIISRHNMSQPLFLYLPFQSVHGPLEVPEEWESQFCSHTKNDTRKTKCGMVAVLDSAIQNITGLMDTRGFFDNMIMIFTTDNGGPVWDAGNNWPLRGAKATLWEGGTRGTGFIYSKNLLGSPRVHNGLIHAVDWFPTIMNIVGAEIPGMIDGVSQWRSIKYDTLSPRTGFVYNIDSLSNHGAIRDGDWKLIKGSPGNWNDWYPVPGVDDQEYQSGSDADDLGPNDYQLFNIKDDPTERNDVKEKYPDVLAKMKARLEELWKGEIPANFPKGDPASNPKNFNGAWSPGWC